MNTDVTKTILAIEDTLKTLDCDWHTSINATAKIAVSIATYLALDKETFLKELGNMYDEFVKLAPRGEKDVSET